MNGLRGERGSLTTPPPPKMRPRGAGESKLMEGLETILPFLIHLGHLKCLYTEIERIYREESGVKRRILAIIPNASGRGEDSF